MSEPNTPAHAAAGERDDDRITRLAEQVEALRRRSHATAGESQQVLLNLAEIKLNLARQDKMLGRMERAVHGNGNGSPGLILRVDRAERALAVYARFLWLVTGIVVSLLVKLVVGSLHG